MGNLESCFGIKSNKSNPADSPQTARQQTLAARYRQSQQNSSSSSSSIPMGNKNSTAAAAATSGSGGSNSNSLTSSSKAEASTSSLPLLPAIILPDGLPVLSDPTAYDNYNQKCYHYDYFFGNNNTMNSGGEKNTLLIKGYPQLRRPARLLLLEALRPSSTTPSSSPTQESSSSGSGSTGSSASSSPHAESYPFLTKLLETIPSLSLTTHWCLVYSSLAHGQNLTRLLKAATAIKGPSLLIVKEKIVSGGNSSSSPADSRQTSHQHHDDTDGDHHHDGSAMGVQGRTFGGYADCQWTNVDDRKMEDKRNAAAHRRDSHFGSGGGSSSSASKARETGPHQAGQFFGGSECFVFTTGDAEEETTTEGKLDKIRIYKSKYNGNANYLYCWDKHPDKSRIGIGFGSTENNNVGEFALFLDRYLSLGNSSLHLCPTYGSPRLSSSSQFKIFAVELYALDCSSCFPGAGTSNPTSRYAKSNMNNNASSTGAANNNQHKKFTEHNNFVKVGDAVDLEKMLGPGWDLDIEYDKFGNPILPEGATILDREQDMAFMRIAGKEFATDETRDACYES